MIRGGHHHLKGAFAWYSSRLETHPLTTKGITSGLISGTGDILCQCIVYTQSRTDIDDSRKSTDESFVLDVSRTGRFALLGAILVAPVVHYWYDALMRRIPGRTISSTLKRTFWDQILFAPVFIPTFMTSLMLLEGKKREQVYPKLEADLADAVVTNWCLWIPAQLINFRYVPSRFQVLFSNCVALVWNTYFSYKASGSAETFVRNDNVN